MDSSMPTSFNVPTRPSREQMNSYLAHCSDEEKALHMAKATRRFVQFLDAFPPDRLINYMNSLPPGEKKRAFRKQFDVVVALVQAVAARAAEITNESTEGTVVGPNA